MSYVTVPIKKPEAQPQGEVTVRIGTLDDLDAVMELSMLAVEDNGFLGADPQKLLTALYPALCQDHGIVGLTVEQDGRVSGGILLHISTHWYSDAPFLEEKSIFIHPEFRAAKGGRAKQLAEFAKKVSDTLGLPLLIGVLSTTRTEGKVRMYRRTFGEPAGAFFLYNGATGAHRSDTEH